MSVVIMVEPNRRESFAKLTEVMMSKFPPEVALRVTVDVVPSTVPKKQRVYVDGAFHEV